MTDRVVMRDGENLTIEVLSAVGSVAMRPFNRPLK